MSSPGPVSSVFNDAYAAEQFERYRQDPSSVDESWRQFFRFAEQVSGGAISTAPRSEDHDRKVAGAARYTTYLRTFGHLAVQLDPLGTPPPGAPELTPEFHGITEQDLDETSGASIGFPHLATARDVANRLRQRYCANLAVEVAHLADEEERAWFRQLFTAEQLTRPLTAEEKQGVLQRLTEVDGFERFLGRTFVGYKRFSIEGTDALVPMLDAAITESAADDGLSECWHLARNHAELPTPSARTRDCAEEPLRVRVTRIVEDRVATLLLHHFAGVHHRHAIAELRDHTKVVGDQHDGGAESLTQIAQQLKDLRLNRHVECCGWLVSNEQFRLAGERHGDHHALRHTTRDLVWVGIGTTARIWNADEFQQLNAAHARRLLIKPLMDAQHLADLVGELLHRVQRGVRLLEDHRDSIPTNLLHLSLTRGEQILAVKADAAARDLSRWCDQAEDGE